MANVCNKPQRINHRQNHESRQHTRKSQVLWEKLIIIKISQEYQELQTRDKYPKSATRGHSGLCRPSPAWGCRKQKASGGRPPTANPLPLSPSPLQNTNCDSECKLTGEEKWTGTHRCSGSSGCRRCLWPPSAGRAAGGCKSAGLAAAGLPRKLRLVALEMGTGGRLLLWCDTVLAAQMAIYRNVHVIRSYRKH